MRMAGSEIELSASDLSGFLSRIHLPRQIWPSPKASVNPLPGSTQCLLCSESAVLSTNVVTNVRADYVSHQRAVACTIAAEA